MLEAWTQVRAAKDKLADPSYEQKMLEESDDEEDDDDIDDAALEKLELTRRGTRLFAASR